MPAPLTKEQLAHGGILAHAHKLLTDDPLMSFGEAVDQAVDHARIPVPQEIQESMLVALFKLSGTGFPPKFPDPPSRYDRLRDGDSPVEDE